MSARLGRLPRADVWLHGASVGDARALAPLVAAIEARWPELRLLYTAQTRGGLAMARRLFPTLPVHPAPLPVSPIIGAAVRAVRPRLMIWEYLELWPAWVRACRAAGVRTLVVDGRVSRRSVRVRPLLKGAAAALDLFCARTAEDAEAAVALGVDPARLRITGNGKHDGVAREPPEPSAELRAAVGPVDVVVGSLHPDEEADALHALAHAGLRALIAPRYPRRAAALLRRSKRLGVPARLRTDGPGPPGWVILDTIGELAAAYALAPTAIVGGTFGARQGQTLVEPAAWGCAVVHGPAVANVREEARAIDGRGGWPEPHWAAACARVQALRDRRGPDPRSALPRLFGATARHLAAVGALLAVDPRAGG